MRTRIVLAVLCVLPVAACSNDSVTIGDVEDTTIVELQTAVHDAASKLSQRESIPIAVIYFVDEEPERVIRYEWIDFRRGRQVLAVYMNLVGDNSDALSLSAGEWATASESRSWQRDSSAESTFERIPAVALLGRLTGEAIGGTPDQTITRQEASDGSELWRLVDHDGAMSREWIISPEGMLQFYSIASREGLDHGAAKIVYEFGVSEENPDPIVVPDVGTPLDLDELGIPPALRSLEGSE